MLGCAVWSELQPYGSCNGDADELRKSVGWSGEVNRDTCLRVEGREGVADLCVAYHDSVALALSPVGKLNLLGAVGFAELKRNDYRGCLQSSYVWEGDGCVCFLWLDGKDSV